ncbi:hypothetical protein E0500_000140 [Streptomyces sp. KM273126]|uniref:hypothetical protein n=1 Tax=Streptomyces sp. KM273126 TaxID=2545247 RepID=UPI0014055CCD|nr:hypothetical protein [Streptomyces sp. KM273126]MBA2805922.1 hypothetical protein [Streptomyces sp. KM273126]
MPALDHRLIRLKALPDGFQAELIKTAERGRTGRGEDGMEHVEVFRTGSVGRTSILEDLDRKRCGSLSPLGRCFPRWRDDVRELLPS